jgi:hypothetical protein
MRNDRLRDVTERKPQGSGTAAKKHIRTLAHRRDRLADTPALAEERDAITYAIDMLERITWKRTASEWPKPGEKVYTASNVAGLGVAVFTGNAAFLCACGCEQTISDVTAWSYGPPAPGPTWGPR